MRQPKGCQTGWYLKVHRGRTRAPSAPDDIDLAASMGTVLERSENRGLKASSRRANSETQTDILYRTVEIENAGVQPEIMDAEEPSHLELLDLVPALRA